MASARTSRRTLASGWRLLLLYFTWTHEPSARPNARAPSASCTCAAIPLDCVVSGGHAAILFDCVILEGQTPELLVTHDRAMELVKEFADKGKVVPSHRCHYNMCNIRSTFETSKWKYLQHTSEDWWNTWNIHMKHLQKHLKTLEKSLQNICNIQIKYLQHMCETYAISRWNTYKHTPENRWNIWNIHLQQTCISIAPCATSRSTFATAIWNTCNILLKHMKHLKHTLATCTESTMPPCCLDEWRLVVSELNTRGEVGGSAWSSPVLQRRDQLACGAASHEASPLACLLEHSSWRLGGGSCGERAVERSWWLEEGWIAN
jgi:hypothetical protein